MDHKTWMEIVKYSSNFDCDIPQELHTSIQYSCYENYKLEKERKNNEKCASKIVVVDICENDPKKWKIYH